MYVMESKRTLRKFSLDLDVVSNIVVDSFHLYYGNHRNSFSKKDFPQFHHISTGDLLRSHVRKETKLGLEAAQYMKEGKLVPDELMIGLVVEESEPFLEKGESLLLDGFPRTVGQAEALAKSVHVDMVVNLDIPNDTIVERLTDR